jgi:hypothetical protein
MIVLVNLGISGAAEFMKINSNFGLSNKVGGKFGALACVLFVASACATIVEGTEQTVAVNTEPSGAACSLTRAGTEIGTVDPTPGELTVGKSRHPIAVACKKEGYEDGAGTLKSGFQPATVNNLVFGGGLVGVGVDAASGAMNQYPDSIDIRLQALPEADGPAVPTVDSPGRPLPDATPGRTAPALAQPTS